MSQISIENCSYSAKNGGSIKNSDVNIKNSELKFSNNGIDFSDDESVALIKEILKHHEIKDIKEIIVAIKSQSSEEGKINIFKQSVFAKYTSSIPDIMSFINTISHMI